MPVLAEMALPFVVRADRRRLYENGTTDARQSSLYKRKQKNNPGRKRALCASNPTMCRVDQRCFEYISAHQVNQEK
jgi:hypothetical protein